jgi:hypothetical protein
VHTDEHEPEDEQSRNAPQSRCRRGRCQADQRQPEQSLRRQRVAHSEMHAKKVRLTAEMYTRPLMRQEEQLQPLPFLLLRWLWIEQHQLRARLAQDDHSDQPPTVATSDVVASDETSVRVMKKTCWEWVFVTAACASAAHSNRDLRFSPLPTRAGTGAQVRAFTRFWFADLWELCCRFLGIGRTRGGSGSGLYRGALRTGGLKRRRVVYARLAPVAALSVGGLSAGK